jgi:hypothetical protein
LNRKLTANARENYGMADDLRQPEIYKYIDTKFEKLYQIIGEFTEKLNSVVTAVDILKSQERPSEKCRAEIEKRILEKLETKQDKISEFVFPLFIIIILGAYSYCLILQNMLNEVIKNVQ